MSDPKVCPVCGSEHARIYYEGPPGPDREDELHVAQFFCSIAHLIKWLHGKGFEIPDLSRKAEYKKQVRGDNTMKESEDDDAVTVEIQEKSINPSDDEVELEVVDN